MPTLQQWDLWLSQSKTAIANLGISVLGERWATHACFLDADHLEDGTFKVAKVYTLSLETLQARRPSIHAIMQEVQRRRFSTLGRMDRELACSFVVVTWNETKIDINLPCSFSRTFGFGMGRTTHARMITAGTSMLHLIKAVNSEPQPLMV